MQEPRGIDSRSGTGPRWLAGQQGPHADAHSCPQKGHPPGRQLGQQPPCYTSWAANRANGRPGPGQGIPCPSHLQLSPCSTNIPQRPAGPSTKPSGRVERPALPPPLLGRLSSPLEEDPPLSRECGGATQPRGYHCRLCIALSTHPSQLRGQGTSTQPFSPWVSCPIAPWQSTLDSEQMGERPKQTLTIPMTEHPPLHRRKAGERIQPAHQDTPQSLRREP